MSHTMHDMDKKKRFSRWPLILLANIAILLVVGISTARETYRDWKVDQELTDLQSQVKELEVKRTNLSELIKKLNSDEMLDEQARAKLGMQKPGERVIVLRGLDDVYEIGDLSTEDHDRSDNQSNPSKWFTYFFSH